MKYLMHIENQFSCGLRGQVSKTAKKLQGLNVRKFGIILHKIGHVCPFSGLMFWEKPCLMYGCLLLRTFVYYLYMHSYALQNFFGEFGIFWGKAFPQTCLE